MVQFASYLRRVLRKTRLIFPRINGPNVKLYPPVLSSCIIQFVVSLIYAILSFQQFFFQIMFQVNKST